MLTGPGERKIHSQLTVCFPPLDQEAVSQDFWFFFMIIVYRFLTFVKIRYIATVSDSFLKIRHIATVSVSKFVLALVVTALDLLI